VRNTDSGEEYAPRLQVQIHQVERDTTLQVSVYATNSYLVPDVDYFEVREVRFHDWFVNGLILFDAPEEVPFRILRGHVLVIRVTHANFERDIGSDDRRVVADRLEEYEGHPFFFSHPSLDEGSAKETGNETGYGATSETNLRSLVLFVASDHCIRWTSGSYE
jgi:hypothetical protein